ncbi:hypothetical protein KKF97_09210 [Myxococcota bacterium]|nr:hypothetical protein [Myxococcota bacterium]
MIRSFSAGVWIHGIRTPYNIGFSAFVERLWIARSFSSGILVTTSPFSPLLRRRRRRSKGEKEGNINETRGLHPGLESFRPRGLMITPDAGKQGSREAGKQGSREAGKQASREAGKQASREAGKQASREAGKQGRDSVAYQEGQSVCSYNRC